MGVNEVREQTARVFRNGRSRAVRIPKEFEFEGDEVRIRKETDGSLRILPLRQELSPKEIVEWLRRQPPLTEEEYAAFTEVDDSDMKPLDDVEP